MTYIISFCCNDPDNGVFTGSFDAIRVTNKVEDMFSAYGKPTRISKANGILRVGRIKNLYMRSNTWFGNWCWDAYVIDSFHVNRIVNYLKYSRNFELEEAWDEIYRDWEMGAFDIRGYE